MKKSSEKREPTKPRRWYLRLPVLVGLVLIALTVGYVFACEVKRS